MSQSRNHEQQKRLKVAVTGASGFIGNHLLRELQRHPVELRATSRQPGRIKHLPATIETFSFDLCSYTGDPFERFGSPDLLIHLAWDDLDNYQTLAHSRLHLPSHYRFLQQMIAAGLPALFVAGTCFEYGLQCGALVEGITTQPLLPYAYAKDELRKQLQSLQSEYPYRLTWGRLFYMYGQGQKKSLYTQLMQSIENGEGTFDMSGGEQLRDYLPVGEVAKLIALLALKCANAGPVNICSGQPVTVRNLVADWIESVDAKIVLNLGHYPYPDYEPMAFWGDRRKLDSLLG